LHHTYHKPVGQALPDKIKKTTTEVVVFFMGRVAGQSYKLIYKFIGEECLNNKDMIKQIKEFLSKL